MSQSPNGESKQIDNEDEKVLFVGFRGFHFCILGSKILFRMVYNERYLISTHIENTKLKIQSV